MPSPCYSERLDAALALAAAAFRARTRKGSHIPYLSHLLSVLALVMEQEANEDVCIAALLHDYVEDIEGATLAEVESRFGPRVAQLVEACTDAQTLPKPPWRPRKEAHLARMATMDGDMRLLITADKVHNLRTLNQDYPHLGESLWTRFRGGRDGTLWYYTEACRVLGEGWSHPLLEQLKSQVHLLLQQSSQASPPPDEVHHA